MVRNERGLPVSTDSPETADGLLPARGPRLAGVDLADRGAVGRQTTPWSSFCWGRSSRKAHIAASGPFVPPVSYLSTESLNGHYFKHRIGLY
jgi:hypothetical protein